MPERLHPPTWLLDWTDGAGAFEVQISDQVAAWPRSEFAVGAFRSSQRTAIEVFQHALAAAPRDDPQRVWILSYLGLALWTRFERTERDVTWTEPSPQASMRWQLPRPVTRHGWSSTAITPHWGRAAAEVCRSVVRSTAAERDCHRGHFTYPTCRAGDCVVA